ncbi:hypothetical protein [Acetivibrio straminisolvens]|uniref:Endo-1,4-beta-xylanase A n=1 Tax=Acetivibrio straminisolvens JCM 21531 TaxID=1294263 RepID=W4V255_9FIRM|nr:hypothetical protein [Acetivibrio straminisolvens]GAE87296.1 endo-1,4-beta-xylanase A precursor [Acetivibrio straminisolvens JCM 21531]
MKRAASLISIITLLLTFIIPIEGVFAVEGNLLYNPGFELGSTEGGILMEIAVLMQSTRMRTAEAIALLLRTGLRSGMVWPRICWTSLL